MNPEDLQKLLENVANGRMPVSSAMEQLQHLSMEDIEYAHVDHHRSLRKGFPEVIFGEGKTADQIAGIMEKMVPRENIVLVTRVSAEKANHLSQHFPEAVYHADARMLILEKSPPRVRGKGSILVMSAGTSDIPVAKEAYLTAQAMGNRVEVVYDVGVAGIHRLFAHKEAIDRATVLIVAAGMEGALPSVVGGLVNRPVIGVPTSIGYGTSLGGLTPLFAMLNSCSSNVAVVNIDNGFGAGYLAAMINRE
ncbi:MAG: nickel pincer cofactor biosynthesis protein LarB [Desulfobacteraceae bacterium]|nr:nickel pincer cofactor biosynthesis protein LarB [Desulfobacteraceae bacterium]